jgi:NAD(P)-dependent dehydrogenase (short-subunit alcohol dehydrogenase family)
MSDISGKVVIITGSSSGIGQATAVLFAKSGAFVTIHGRSEDGIKKTKEMILKAGISEDKIYSVQGSITDSEIQKTLIEETVKKFGKLDILINNAGGINMQEKNQRSMEALDYILDLNLKAPIALTELAIPHLEKTKGCILNVSSISSEKGQSIIPFYSISKAGLDHFTRNYAAILAPMGIRINNLNPGLTDTPALNQSGSSGEEIQKMKDFYLTQIPLKRAAESEEMAEFLLFMASKKASYMTGQMIKVDGGFLIHSPTLKLD